MMPKGERANNHFSTRDIKLASYLMARDVPLSDIQPLDDGNHCRFFFQHPPQHLLDAWLAGDAKAPAGRVVDAYRHLLREGRAAQEGKRPTIFSGRGCRQ